MDKTGVDPVSGGTIRVTSDEFFSTNTKRFDVVFIDGLHEHEQASRDAANALQALRSGGFVLFHDMFPTNWKTEHVPRLSTAWSGDVWKVAFELANSTGIEFRLIKADSGVGVAIKLSDTYKFTPLPSLKNERFGYFYEHHRELPVVGPEEGLEFILGQGPGQSS